MKIYSSYKPLYTSKQFTMSFTLVLINYNSLFSGAIDDSTGSIDSIRREKENMPSPKVSLGFGVPSLRLRESMNPICLISV
mmetsp:Transcript_24371/g.44082  ORF Transcript_24371/g.44082 Transcript_24371/m.44082 type:complete len:81 (-) Transcript_24371:567-809(-)